jgi:hypothetical protein
MVMCDEVDPSLSLAWIREFTLKQQVCDIEIRAVLGKLFDLIPPITENSTVSVDKRDGAPARRSIHESRIVAHKAKSSGEVLIWRRSMERIASS